MTIAAATRLPAIQAAVLEWYAANARPLAFRRTTDPWAVLLSEVIAQQTQAARAAEAWERLIALFPTPASMAAVSPATVIREWRGLGYNRRALALHRAATAIVERHGGRVPDDLSELTALPGIGPYTARAVLAIAFDQPVAALDTNIRRVLARLAPGAPWGAATQPWADGFVPAHAAAAWTHALMDLGATICRKQRPRCEACPLRPLCPFEPTAVEPTTRRVNVARFETTTRWLRGRILDRLRDAPDGAWISFDAPIGAHAAGAVHRELLRMAGDGLVERSTGDGALARLPMERRGEAVTGTS